MEETESRYNNRQIERMLDIQSAELKTFFSDLINPLTIKVGETNGRVKQVEIDKAKQEGFNKAFSFIFVSAFGIGTALFGWVLYQEANLDQRILNDTQAAISQALLPYAKP